MPQVPILNLEIAEVKDFILTKLDEPKAQRKLVLVIVSIALLLDNMLYMVIVPIIPDYLRRIGSWDTHIEGGTQVTEPPRTYTFSNNTGTWTYTVPERNTGKLVNGVVVYEGEDSAIGVLFASKAMIQLFINPFSGALIDRIGYDKPMMIGLTIMFLSTAVFAIGSSYTLLFLARSLQGVGSAFADTSGLAMIADRYTEESERTKALGIALAFISFGCLVAPPFGGLMYELAGKEVPFLILAFVCVTDAVMLWLVMKPIKKQQKEQGVQRPAGTPIWVLFMDPYIACCAGALIMANVSLAFLEPTISVWMMDTMHVSQWEQGMIWLPAFFPHVAGVIITVKLSGQYPQYQYLMAAGGLALEGVCSLMIPFAKSYWVLMIPISGICFGIALVDTALLPTLGYLVDLRYVSVYGSIYAIADISYSFAYAFGPIIAGRVMESIGFLALNIGIAVSNLAYVPVLIMLRHIYDKGFQDEANILMKDPPDKQYQTYAMQDRKVVPDYSKNYGRLDDEDDDYSGSGGHRVTFQETSVDRPAAAPPGGSSSGPANNGPSNPYQYPSGNNTTSSTSNTAADGWRGTVTNLPGRILTRASTLVSAGLGGNNEAEDKQGDLPKLPVPELEKTLQRYLEAVQPILTNAQFEKAQELAKQLAENEGPELQHHLAERQLKMKNWAYEWWLNDMYLNNPLCLPVNSNPGGVWPPQKFNTIEDQLDFASKLTTFMLDFKDILDRNELPVEKAASREPGQPLCMTQHYRLMTTYRVPCLPRDYQRDTSTILNDHIIVAYRKHFFTCPIRTEERRLTTKEIFQQFKTIVQTDISTNNTPVGILSSQMRPIWADERVKLRVDDTNKSSLEEIETCQFIICFDDPLPAQYFNVKNASHVKTGHWISETGRDETNMLHQMLHGGGSIFNTGNRWFDKTLQFIISSDGATGLCYEHSPAEGIAVLNLIDEFHTKLNAGEISNHEEEAPPGSIPPPIQLEWCITSESKSAITEASMAIDQLVEDIDLLVFRFRSYGKNFIKKCKCSPDVFIQLALQLAYYNLHGKMVATYESASTRRFKLGRVDCIRANSMEALEWVKSMRLDEPASEKIRKFQAAVEKQTSVMVDNILGEGIDIHLLGLRQQAVECSMDVPGIFLDDTFKVANHFALSTSQLPTKQDQFMGYGAVVSDGYGASYNPQADSIVFCLSSFYSCPHTSTAKFSISLQKSLDSIKELLDQ